MSEQRTITRAVVETTLTFLPWLISMYTLYYFEYGEIWTTDTPHRGKTSVIILVTGMLGSFLMYTFFAKRRSQ